jgi:hypothetical protein
MSVAALEQLDEMVAQRRVMGHGYLAGALIFERAGPAGWACLSEEIRAWGERMPAKFGWRGRCGLGR